MSKPVKLTTTLTPATDKEGIDLSQLYERLSLTSTERLRKNFRMDMAVEELRKAGQNIVTETDIEKLLKAFSEDIEILESYAKFSPWKN